MSCAPKRERTNAKPSCAFAALCGLVLACGNEPAAKPESPPASSPVSQPSKPDPAPEPLPKRPEVEAFPAGNDEAQALQAIHSLPAWSAALERYRFLARRGQSGSIHGLLVETESGLRLVDETIGQGALSIPVSVDAALELSLPMRAVLWGAWHPETEPRWRWRATRVESLSPAKTPLALVPAFEPLEAPMPDGISLPSEASRRGGTISFVVKKRSDRVGDGWLIADDSKGKAVARLLLPGEADSYGDQSQLASDERWKLRKNTRYWAKIRSFRPPSPGELPVFRARSGPHWDRTATNAPPAPKQ